MFYSLKIKKFRIYWLAMFISLIGTWIQILAQSWLVFQLTNSAFLLGVVGFLSSLPVFFLSLFGGVLADRMNKRTILIFTQIAFMVLALILAILTQARLITTTQIIIIALLNGMVMAFDAPSRQAVIVDLVDRKNLLNAVALNSVAFNFSRIIGPVAAGILVSSIGMSGCFYINAVSFIPIIIVLSLIKVNNNLQSERGASAFGDLIAGLRTVKDNRMILILVIMVAISSLFGVSYMIFMPVFAKEILNVGIKGMGILMSFTGLGALAGALMLAALGDFKYKGRVLCASSIVFSFSLVLFSLSRIYALSLFSLMLVGASSVTAISLINTLLQHMVSDAMRGRVMSVFMFTFAGIMPFGNLFAGSIAHIIGVSQTVMLNGIICTLFFTIINIAYPQVRKLR